MSPTRTSNGAIVSDASVERRAELLVATTRVISRRGYAGTRFQDVAEEAGVAVGTLQHHFGTRSRMLAEALEQWINDVDEQLVELRGGDGDAWDRLHTILLHVATRIGERNESWRMFLDFTGEALKDPELRRTAARSQQRWLDGFVETIREGVEAGTFQPVVGSGEAGAILSALVDGLALQVFAMESDLSGAEATAWLTDTARVLLRPHSA